MDTRLKLKNKIKTIAKTPGIYFWLGKNKQVLYVGRATNLRSRLNQYFQKNIDPRIGEMVALAQDVKFIKTDSLLEAVILEAQNIKKYWPKYNIKDRDDRSFIYIIIPKTEFPRPQIVRGQELKKYPKNKALVFGPYQSLNLVQNALRIIRRLFPYSTCQPQSGRACFDYQIGLCPGACVGAITKKEYTRNIKNIVLLLSGEKKKLLKKLIKENPDKIKALKHIQDVSLLTRPDDLSQPEIQRIEGYDISHLQGKESYGSMVVFSHGKMDKQNYRLFKIKTAPAGDDERALAEVLTRRFNHPEWPAPDLLLIDGGRPQISFLSKVLKQQGITWPLVGISKLAGDELVLASGATKNFQKLAAKIKPTLLQVREEAHRFGNQAGRRARRIK